jgi:hypothetical protein
MSDKVLTITLMAIAIQLCSDLGPPLPSPARGEGFLITSLDGREKEEGYK